ncbi:family 90 glycosyltransferase [Cryphonectria parasitica EP155]|uniref:Family 90 glycosyltransferase n=1 Tax=Cryphonectria parasitica (strain ATCC 38755 / EP155) TaxID=660469 RepID=A0A9P4XZC1_CRYP1|nr:family 90 glycosyltransferase [Cryphonectria parasitica EP155]KAF3764109.1 family 90 glycosyltransferase [Cryphonectria parasitica EP155]
MTTRLSRSLLLSSITLGICTVVLTIRYSQSVAFADRIQCSSLGFYLLLPLWIFILELVPLMRSPRVLVARLLKGDGLKLLASILLFGLTGRLFWSSSIEAATRTSVICPTVETLEESIPVVQVALLCVDAFLISALGYLVHDDKTKPTTGSRLPYVCWAAAGFITLFEFVTLTTGWAEINDLHTQMWNTDWITKRDMTIDSIVAALALTAMVHMLCAISAITMGLMLVLIGAFVQLETGILNGALVEVLAGGSGIMAVLLLCASAGGVLHFSRASDHKVHAYDVRDGSHKRSTRLLLLHMLGGFALIIGQSLLQFQYTNTQAIRAVIRDAEHTSSRWLGQATVSKTLEEAAGEYKKRYGIPPPPGFDAWYNYAVENESPIIDNFDQIHSSLLPFWGTTPAELRERTSHMLETPTTSVGVIIIGDGKMTFGPHDEQYTWMLEHIAEMMEPFAQWLPDMQVAFNLDDECRVSVPYELMQSYLQDGEKSRGRLARQTELSGFSKTASPPWSDQYLEDDPERFARVSPYFHPWYSQPIFYEWVASTCPPGAPVHSFHWWDKKVSCASCYGPHTVGGFVSNWTAASELCHQPDLFYLHGGLLRPQAARPTHDLFPIFSQSRLHSYNDIIYPSVFVFASNVQFDDSRAVAWEDKGNSVFWRGKNTEATTVNGLWESFLRPRFVSSAQDEKKLLAAEGPGSSNNLVIDVSFAGEFGRCDKPDCIAETTHFYGSPDAEIPGNVPFDTAWQHRHLVDLDGAAFSGRFPAFVASDSLPYRTALWQAWWEDRIHAFVHFVPVDVRLVRDLWKLIRFFGSDGEAEGKKIAEAGAKWAAKAMRKEDMQIYMFRLLLEWARLVDDAREEIGFQSKDT